jgi:hypothetical protein
MARDWRSDPKTHARFLAYKERHAYFGRGERRALLSLAEFGALDDERLQLLAVPKDRRPEEATKRLAEIESLLLLD